MLPPDYIIGIIDLRKQLESAAPRIVESRHGTIDIVDIRNHLRYLIGEDHLLPFSWSVTSSVYGLCDDLDTVMYRSMFVKRPLVPLETLCQLVEQVLQLQWIPKRGRCVRLRNLVQQAAVSPVSLIGSVAALWSR